MAKQSWLDDSGQSLLDEYVAELETFADAFADGRIDERELQQQEDRLVALLKQVEPKLDDALHAEVTRLLCELSAYNIMQTFHQLKNSASRTTFVP
ncbi:MAG TPA: hypothetical protein PKD54_06760 [Pirellulaceae bacterium]|nr:hypothetical protein [Pirellulaceae bacterium]